MKKHVRFVSSLVLFLVILVTSLVIAQAVELRYIGINQFYSTLDISSSGAAFCEGEVELQKGYTANLKVELKQDGVTIKTWNNSGSGYVTAGGTYYVMSGHNYIVKTSATVYDSNNKVVESPSVDSIEEYY